MRRNKGTMIKTALLISILGFLASNRYPVAEFENVTLSGIIASNMEWSGTIWISGDILVPATFTVNITPGTRVVFLSQDDENQGEVSSRLFENYTDPTASSEYEKSHSSLWAKIIADDVVFTSGAKEKGYADWSELRLFNGSIIQNSIIEYSRGGVIVFDGALVTDTVSRYSLWTCFDLRGGNVTKSLAHHCWDVCVTATNNSVFRDSSAYECLVGIHMEENATVKNNTISQSCTPINLVNESAKDFRELNKISITTPVSKEAVFEYRQVHPICP
ncbi:MAG: hypothetical protein GOV01_00405 [Candidatus Altiarchaeota archaeon]|nr:hypothetical protein [Candidatus Altiarchaeota archaeon]